MSEGKKREKQRCSTKRADTNLKSSRHSTCVKESRGWGEMEEEENQDDGGNITDKRSGGVFSYEGKI